MVADNKVFLADGEYRDEYDIFINITYDAGKVGIGTYSILWNDPSEVKKDLPPICRVGNITIKHCELESDMFKVVSNSSNYNDNGTILCKTGRMFYEDSLISNITARCDENANWSFNSSKLHCYNDCELVSDKFEIVSKSSHYNNNGTVLCKVGKMFYEDSLISNTTARCNENANWSFNSSKLRCYKAPSSIKLLIPKLIKDKEEIEIICLFSNDSNPQPNKVKLQIGDKSYFRKKDEVLKMNITASDDLKKAYCQVLNVYTLNEQFQDEGMSKINTVNVSFRPVLKRKSFTCEINENNFTNECGFKFKSNPQYQKDIYVYNIVDNKEISNYLTHYIVFNTSSYDPKSREQTLNLLYSKWLGSGNFSVYLNGNTVQMHLFDKRIHQSNNYNLPIKNEVTVCYFNKKGVLSKLCKLRVITDKIISETRIRVFQPVKKNINNSDNKTIEIKPIKIDFKAKFQTFNVSLNTNLTKETHYEILFEEKKLFFLYLLKQQNVETRTIKIDKSNKTTASKQNNTTNFTTETLVTNSTNYTNNTTSETPKTALGTFSIVFIFIASSLVALAVLFFFLKFCRNTCCDDSGNNFCSNFNTRLI